MKQSFSMKGNVYTNEKTDNVCAGGLPLLQTGFCNTQEQLCIQNPQYREIEIQVIEEEQHQEIAAQYDYYYVPCYFIGKRKLFEGVPTPEHIRAVLEAALQ